MVVRYPLLTEKAVNLIEKENKIVFIVDKASTKQDIRKEVEDQYGVKVGSIKTVVSPKGEKRAFVKLVGKNAAANLATKLNIM
ncbi:MAG: 50S ribosomal protein L23 [Candidatus Diapherotrites archaeon]|nr:50S ribosomal protein L23 [Candidatus Diapherotrites archaeon]